MGHGMKDFLRREDGVVALIFAVMAIPFIAMGGWAVDYLRMYHVKDYLQSQADAAALTALLEGVEQEEWEDAFRAEISRQYNGSWADEIDITGSWLTEDYFQVTARAKVPLTFMHVIPGIPGTQDVIVNATAELLSEFEPWEPPDFAELDPEAGDYNRIYLYCYWPGRDKNDPDLPFRTQMVPIADNGGSMFSPFIYVQTNGDVYDHRALKDNGTYVRDPDLEEMARELLMDYPAYGFDGRELGIYERDDQGGKRRYKYVMPNCPNGSHMSYRLENVRDARTKSNLWDDGGHRYNYYTDTILTPGQPEHYDGLKMPDGQKVTILETVLCDTEAECVGESDGGVIPEGKNRSPHTATEPCSPGKFMYYGWEDRPPGIGAWTDEDYDDIRIIIECPKAAVVGDRSGRLVS